MNTTYETLAEFGKIHKNDKRIIVVALKESTTDGKSNRYLSFHEHYLKDDGKLAPCGKNNKFPIISFTLPWRKEAMAELKDIVNGISEYLTAPAKPVDKEEDCF